MNNSNQINNNYNNITINYNINNNNNNSEKNILEALEINQKKDDLNLISLDKITENKIGVSNNQIVNSYPPSSKFNFCFVFKNF